MKTLFTVALVASVLQLNAQFSREYAVDILIEEVVGADSLQFHRFYSKIDKMYNGDTLWGDGYFNFHICPYAENWVFFVDDLPLAHWAHPCRWIFFNIYTGDYEVIPETWPPLNYLSNHQLFFEEWERIFETGYSIFPAKVDIISIFPNPAKDKFEVQGLRFKDEAIILLRIYCKQGLKVEELEVPYESKSITIDISDYKQGLYYLQFLQHKQVTGTAKVIIK